MPLAGLRILSMAEQFPGTLATMVLSDLGADVIQVERPGTGDPSRFLTGFYEALNRGKRSVVLDIRDLAQKAELLELIAAADVFLEGSRPGKLEKQGLGYPVLSALNPRLVYCPISGYGQTGPYRDRPAHDLSLQSVGGALEERIDGVVTGQAVGGSPVDPLFGIRQCATVRRHSLNIGSPVLLWDRRGQWLMC